MMAYLVMVEQKWLSYIVVQPDSLLLVFPIKNEPEMPGTLLDVIRKLGAPNGFFSDNAKGSDWEGNPIHTTHVLH
jgi:hypothetical protein